MARKKAEAKIVKLVLIKEGTFHIPVTKDKYMYGNNNVNSVTIEYPLMITGAGQERTTIHGGGFRIQGTREEGKRVNMQGMTIWIVERKWSLLFV